MANVDRPNGFLPWTNQNAGSGRAPIKYLPLLATNAAIGRGDPVKLAAGGVDRAAAGDALCGVAAVPKAANSGGTIAVWADPDQEFVAQTDNGDTGDLTGADDMRKNANFVAGTPSNGQSIAEIDENTGDTAATLPFKVLRLAPLPGNAFGEFNRLIVKINNHQFGSHTGTAGIAT